MVGRLGRFVLWKPHRALRLAADRLFSELRPERYGDVRIALAKIPTFGDMVRVLKERREDDGFSRYREEALLVAFEARRKQQGEAMLPDELYVEFRREGLGLDDRTKLIHIIDACIARYRDKQRKDIPEAVRLIVCGSKYLDFEAAGEEMAVIVGSEEPWRRRRNVPQGDDPDLRYVVLKEWVEANGWRLKQHQVEVDKFVERHRDESLAFEPAESFANLAPAMIDLARQLAARVAPGDRVLAYYVFRVLQRIQAYRRGPKVMWNARWLRGKKHHRAIEGTSGKPALEAVIHDHILNIEKGHSGATGNAAIYRLKIEIVGGNISESAAAAALVLELDAKKKPRKGRGGRIVQA
jgi:hypothetical protein